MIGEKVLQFENKQVDLPGLVDKIEEYLKGEKFQTQKSSPSHHGTILQAKKGGWLTAVVAADRALTISVSGSAEDCVVRIGIGKWEEHLAVTAAETLLVSALFLPVDVAETAWNFEIEDKLAKQIESLVGGPPTAQAPASQ